MNITPFPGFETRRLRVNGVTIHGIVGGQGPALLMLHGYPRSHVMWHAIAPKLAQHYTVVCPDLRGYGDSSKPRGLSDHSNDSYHILAGSGLSAKGLKAFAKPALAAYVRAFSDPRTMHATCEDYRASGGIDLDHDRADRGKKLALPVQILWGKRAVVGTQFDPMREWRKVARNVTGHAIDCGHFVPEEKPAQTLAAIRSFLVRHENA